MRRAMLYYFDANTIYFLAAIILLTLSMSLLKADLFVLCRVELLITFFILLCLPAYLASR